MMCLNLPSVVGALWLVLFLSHDICDVINVLERSGHFVLTASGYWCAGNSIANAFIFAHEKLTAISAPLILTATQKETTVDLGMVWRSNH